MGATRRRLIRITDLDNLTGEYASVQLPNPVFSLSEFDGDLYVTSHTNLLRISPPFTATSTHTDLGQIASGISIRTLETDGTHLWGYDKNNDALYQITPAQSSLSAVEWATVEYPSDVTNPNIDGLLYFNDRWYVTDRSSDALYVLPETIAQGSTVQATQVGNFTEFGAGVDATLGAGHFGGKAYIADDGANTLYRLYDVRWDDDIPVIEIDEGNSKTFDLTTVSQDATGFEFAPSNTSRTWITISGNDLTLTTAPDVTADTDFDVDVRALRSGKYEDTTLTVRVKDTSPPPPQITAPHALPNFRVTGKGATWIEVAWDQGDDGGATITDHEMSIEEGDQPGTTWTSTGSTSRTHRFSNLKKGTEYTIQGRGINSEGEGAASDAVTTTTDTTVTSVPRNLNVTPGVDADAKTALVEFDEPSDLGGQEIDRYESRHVKGSSVPTNTPWDDRGTSRNFTLTNLEKGTAYALEVRTVNTDGESDAAEATFTTDTTIPGAPTNQQVTPGTGNQATTAEVEVEPPEDTGGLEITQYQSRHAEGTTIPGSVQWVNRGTSPIFTLPNLKKGTKYAVETRAVNTEGEGASSGVTTFTTDLTVPVSPVLVSAIGISPTEIAIELELAEDTGGAPLTDIEIRYVEGTGTYTQWESLGLLTVYQLTKLRPSTAYMIQVRARNSEGPSLASNAITVETQSD